MLHTVRKKALHSRGGELFDGSLTMRDNSPEDPDENLIDHEDVSREDIKNSPLQ